MGQKLHSITFHEDHEVLNKNLTPDSDLSLSDQDGSGMLIACIAMSNLSECPKLFELDTLMATFAVCNMQLMGLKRALFTSVVVWRKLY
jgi:hypothetical protein